MSLRKVFVIAPAALAAVTARGAGQFQVPPVPPPTPALGGVSAATSPTQVVTIWDKLGLSKKAKEECLRKLCASPLGQLINNSTAPLQALSGGLLPPFCPLTPSAAELADQGAVGAAAAIKADEAGAAARKAAVRFLGTVDCAVWPEAEAALIGALRGDKNECVRYEAALALGNGCCCTKKTIEALNIVVSCSDRDGALKERSARVHAAAQAALDHCLACYNPVAAAPTGPTVIPPEGGGGKAPGETAPPPKIDKDNVTTAAVIMPVEVKETINPGEAKPGVGVGAMPRAARPTGFQYYALIAQQPMSAIVAEARRVQAMHPKAAISPLQDHSVAGVMAFASANDNAPADAQGTPRAQVVSPKPANLWDILTDASAPTTVTIHSVPVTSPTQATAVKTTRDLAPSVTRRETAMPAMPMPAYNGMELRTGPASTLPKASPTPAAPAVLPKMQPMAPSVVPTSVALPVIQSGSAAGQATTPSTRPVVSPASMPKMETKSAPTGFAPMAMPTAEAKKALSTLSSNTTTAERKQTVDRLANADLVSAPDLAKYLLAAAQSDKEAPDTRVACIRALVRCQAKTPAVMSGLEKLSDNDVSAVRVEAIIGLTRLKMPATASATRPAMK